MRVEARRKRNFELYKAEEKEKTAAATARAESEKDDPMAQLENKTKDSKVEMDILDALDEIRTQNARSASLNTDAVLEEHRRATAGAPAAAAAGPSLDDEDELELRRAFAAQRQKRLREDDDSPGDGSDPTDVAAAASSSGTADSHSRAACLLAPPPPPCRPPPHRSDQGCRPGSSCMRGRRPLPLALLRRRPRRRLPRGRSSPPRMKVGAARGRPRKMRE